MQRQKERRKKAVSSLSSPLFRHKGCNAFSEELEASHHSHHPENIWRNMQEEKREGRGPFQELRKYGGSNKKKEMRGEFYN